MFIQVIQGKVSDEAGLRSCMEKWMQDLQPGAVGYLGTTAGTSDDGTYLALARFESAEAARRNSARPEQGAWWAETEKCFAGEVTFMDCDNVTQWLEGGSDDAGFVQIMEGHTKDPKRMLQLLNEAGQRIHGLRPEIIGGTFATYGDDGFIEAVYFTSEAEAREHEKMEIPDDLRALFDEEQSLAGEISYFDLHQPMLASAKH
jgi:hypothetical protein